MLWYFIFGGYVLGIALGLFFSAPLLTGACFIAGMSLIGVWFRSKTAWGIALAFVLIASGYDHARSTVEMWRVEPNEYTVSGRATIVSEPEIKEHSQAASLRFTECSDTDCPKHIVLGDFSIYEELRYGDVLTVECPLKVPKNLSEDFDYRMYLAMKDISFMCYLKEWHRENDGGGNVIVRLVFRVRDALEKNLDEVVGYPESGLGKGLLFGGNSYLTQETKDAFSRTGLTHIVAVSGANVVIIAECFFLFGIFCGLWRKQALWFAVGGIVLFVIMVGAGASAVRAGLMGGLVLAASYSGRVSDGLRLLVPVLAAMLWFNPLFLRYDLGFQLSFLATLGILLCMPLFERLSRDKESFSMTKEILFMSLSAEIFVLPIIFYNFQTFSTLSLLANLLVLPAIPMAMLFGFLASVAGFVFTPLAKIFGLTAYLVLHYMMNIIQFLGSRVFSVVPVQSFGVWAAFWWYAVLFGAILLLRKKYV